ncbi:MAG: hypothetical protein JST22_09750, partial [Bacteroidetes bacterium]|nr:hypothetical protein [Bacteroidota bacterium]
MAIATRNAVAQDVPQAMNYQAAVRDSLGLPLAGRNIGVRIAILKGSGGPEVYAETHAAKTDDLGLFSIAIGRGTPISGDFTAIDWRSPEYWIAVAVDLTGGGAYVPLGSQQLLSVPYALFARRALYSDTARVALTTAGGSGASWNVAGNGGTNPVSNFVGTADSTDLVFRTGNRERIRITAAGLLQLKDLSAGGTRVLVSNGTSDATVGSRMLVDLIDSAVIRAIGAGLSHNRTFISDLGSDSLFITRVRALAGASTTDSLVVVRLLRDSAFISSVMHHLDSLIRNDTLAVRDSAAIRTIVQQVRTLLEKDTAFITALTGDSLFIKRIKTVGDGLFWSLTGTRGSDPARNFVGTADNNDLAFRTNNIERMRIAAPNGNVGIGTSTPGERLHVAGNIRADALAGPDTRLVMVDANGSLRPGPGAGSIIVREINTVLGHDSTFVASLTGDARFINGVRQVGDSTYWSLLGSRGTDPTRNFLGTTDNQPLAFRTNNAERVRIDAATGNVGIGTAAPGAKLHVAGDLRADALAGTPRVLFSDINGSIVTRADQNSFLAASIDTILASDPAFINGLTNNPTFVSSLTGNTGFVNALTNNPAFVGSLTGNPAFVSDIHTIGNGAWWSLTGSAGTNPATNFLGTTDNQPLAFRTNNAERIRIDATNGNVGIGTVTPATRLHVAGAVRSDALAGTPRVLFSDINGSIVTRADQNSFLANSIDTVLTSDATFINGLTSNATFVSSLSGNTSFVNALTANPTFVTDVRAIGNDTWWSLTGSAGTNPATDFLGTTDNQPLAFRTNNAERIRIDATTGNVGIGTAAPGA